MVFQLFLLIAVGLCLSQILLRQGWIAILLSTHLLFSFLLLFYAGFYQPTLGIEAMHSRLTILLLVFSVLTAVSAGLLIKIFNIKKSINLKEFRKLKN